MALVALGAAPFVRTRPLPAPLQGTAPIGPRRARPLPTPAGCANL